MTARLLAAAALAGLLLAAAPAGAAFEGRNGDVGYQGRAQGVLYLREADGSGLRRLRVAGRPSDPAFSPQGKRIAYASNGNLWVVYADGSASWQLVTGVVLSRSPTWSPEGDRIAFAGGPVGARDLFSIAADGAGLQRLVDGPGDDEAPAWSSRGDVAFVRHTDKRRGDIYVRSADGSVERVTRGRSDDAAPAWSPDGRRIAFTRGSGARAELYVVRAGGGHLRRLTSLPRGVASPAWSPNGKRIAFGMGRRGRRGVFVMRSDGRRVRRVASGAVDARTIDWQAVGGAPIVAAAGDIACDPGSAFFHAGVGTRTLCHQRQTSDLLLKMDLSGLMVLGDIQYEDGQYAKFIQSFHPTWGRLKGLMHPVPGNHEYRDPGAAGYFDYFNGPGQPDGPAGPRGVGYYSFDVGGWHVVALNSQCSHPPSSPQGTDCAAGSPQEQWLRADLAAHPRTCTLAMWHHPMLSSGSPTFNGAVQPLWQALYDGGVDVLLTGHDHGYERFAPMDPTTTRDGARGVRQFVVGTGGKNHQDTVAPQPNSEVRDDSAYGVLQLVLGRGGYRWTYVPEAGASFTDTGASACH